MKTLHVAANTIELLTNAMDYVEQCYKNNSQDGAPGATQSGASGGQPTASDGELSGSDIIAKAARKTRVQTSNGAGIHDKLSSDNDVIVQRSSARRRCHGDGGDENQDGAKCLKSAVSPSHTSTDNDASNSSDKVRFFLSACGRFGFSEFVH